MHWTASGDAWTSKAGRAHASAFYDSSVRAWCWSLTTTHLQTWSVQSYKTAAGARAACERVARRLGVVS